AVSSDLVVRRGSTALSGAGSVGHLTAFIERGRRGPRRFGAPYLGQVLCERGDGLVARMMLACLGTAVAGVALWLAPLAGAKDFKPGDIRVCAAAKCLPLRDRQALDSLSAFYYSAKVVP